MPPRRRPRAHGGEAKSPPSSVPRVCKFYNEGSCRYGQKCKFLHNAAQGRQPGASLVAPAVDTNGTTLLAQTSVSTAETGGSAGFGSAQSAVEEQDGREHTTPMEVPQSAGQALHHQQIDDPGALSPAGLGSTNVRANLPPRKPCFVFQRKGWCKKGNTCQYVHDLNNVQSGINARNTAHEARRRVEEAQKAARERIRQEEEARLERERLERERLEAERLERQRLEAERLERQRLEAERIERERVEAERITAERQRLEAERIAAEREAAAARRAEERERKKREREEKLLREQEAKRRQEAKVTLQFVVQGSNLVTFGPGLEVKRVVPGFDLCKVTIRNLPTDATEKEVANIFKEQGLDDTMFKLLELRPERGGKFAKFLTRNEEAEAMAAGLESLEFRDKILAFEVEENTAWGSMKSSASGTDANTLTFFWNAPSVILIATYETVEEARRKARELNHHRFGYGGRSITAVLNPRPNGPASRYWVEASVKIGNLAPGTMPEDVRAIAGTPNVRPIKSNNYDPQIFLEQLKVFLRMDRCIEGSFQTTELQTGTGRMKGTARFPSQETLKTAADRLNRGGYNWPKIRVAEQHQYSITITNAQYRAQKVQWDSMTEIARGKKAYVRINERRNGQVFVNVEGSEEKEVGELKVRVESLVAGERLGAEHWHSTYASHLGKALFDRVKSETTVLVTVDRRFQALRLFGAGNAVAEAKTLIGQDVERLKLMEFTIAVDRRSVRFFVATGLPILKEALGDDNVSLDVSSRQCSLKLRGGDDAIKHAQRLVEEAVIASRAGLEVPTQTDANEGPPCPICYDTPSHPEILSCGHSCCEPCLRHYIASAATSDTFPLVCMGNEATCNTPISVPIIHRYLTQQRFTMLVDAAFASYIQSNARKFKYCTTPDCTQIYQCDTDRQFHQCPACFSRICSSCNEEAHEGMTCEERKVQSDPAEQERLNNEWAQTNNVKRCPTCDVMTEKTEGCNHMTCRCGSHWCWICRGVFDARTIYTHMQDTHGGIYGAPEPAPTPVAAGFDAHVRRNREVAERLLGQREQERQRQERAANNDDWMQGLNNIKRCPSCNILTEKAGGFDHMTCRCGAHWCWVCAREFTAATIYTHLTNAHGGMGFARPAPAAAANDRPDWYNPVDDYLARRRAALAEQARRRETEQREQAQQRALANMMAARRERERQIAEQAAAMRRDAEKKDSWCAIM